MAQSQTAKLRAVASECDPIFAAIERHRVAAAALDKAADAEQPVFNKLQNQDTTFAQALMETVPKTQAGLLALLRYVQEAEKAHAICLSTADDQRSALLATIERAVRFLGDGAPADDREHRSVTFAMEAPLRDARGLSMAMIMALAGEDRVHGDEEDHADALERLANAVQDGIDQVFKLWSKLH